MGMAAVAAKEPAPSEPLGCPRVWALVTVVDRDVAADDRAHSHGGRRRLSESAGPARSRPGVSDPQLNRHYTELARPRSDFLNTADCLFQ